MKTDPLLARILAPAPRETRARFVTPPWGDGAAPQLKRINRDPTGPMARVDVVFCVWTAAEKQAVADVFGAPESAWNFYAKDFAAYLPDLTDRSPAKDVRRLGEYAVVLIGDTLVALLHSQLHLATDSVAALPLRRFIAQVVGDTECSTWLDSGTAGGIGAAVQEGDTVCAEDLVFDCTGAFKDEPYAHELFTCTWSQPTDWAEAESLMLANAHLLDGAGTTRPPKVWTGHDVLTCDSFLFDDAEDTYGLQTYDNGVALAEEMDAAVLGLVAQDLGDAMPKFGSLRSVSDPQMPDLGSVEKEEERAEKEYDDFGYAAQVMTSTAGVSAIASL